MSKEITNIFNKLVNKTEEENINTIGKLRRYARLTKTETLKKYISNRTNKNWDIKCTIANDELISRGEK